MRDETIKLIEEKTKQAAAEQELEKLRLADEEAAKENRTRLRNLTHMSIRPQIILDYVMARAGTVTDSSLDVRKSIQEGMLLHSTLDHLRMSQAEMDELVRLNKAHTAQEQAGGR